MRAFVVSYQRLTYLKTLCEQLSDAGLEVVIIDNASTYEPLVEWFNHCPYTVYRLKQNLGHLCLWKSGIINEFTDRYFILTDHDLDISGVPKDFPEVLQTALEKNKSVIKAGLSLRIDDLPDNAYTREVIAWESKFWKMPKDINGWPIADIDTTLAVYDKERDFGELTNNRFFSAIRSPYPYSASHRPWYYTKELLEANEEERQYVLASHNYWSQKFKQLIWEHTD